MMLNEKSILGGIIHELRVILGEQLKSLES